MALHTRKRCIYVCKKVVTTQKSIYMHNHTLTFRVNTRRRSLEADESCWQGRCGASDAGLGRGEGGAGLLPVLPSLLPDQTVVLHL